MSENRPVPPLDADPANLAALRESEERYRRIVETTNEGIWAMDEAHNTTFVNRRMAEMLGYAPEVMLGKRVDSFMFPEDMDSHHVEMKNRQQGRDALYERRFRRQDGSELWCLVSAKSIQDAQGRFMGSFAMFTDISERKQAELYMAEAYRALKVEKEKMQRYLDTADTLIVALDKAGTVTMLNRYGLELLGYGEHEIIGRNWFKTVLPQPAGREDVYPIFQAIMRGEMEQTAYHENEILTASGARRLIAWRNTFLRDELGNPMGTLSTGMDLTNHRETERRNQRLQKAESLRRMAGAIAHHFNNQLHTVMGNIEMAGLDLPKGCQAAQALGEAMKAAGRAGDLSAAMLIYLGQSFSERTIHDLSVLCHRSLDRLRACLPAAVTLRADLPDPGPRVSVDADQISLLLDHLVQNAIEAIGPVPGTIRVRIQTWAAEEIPALERFPGDWQPTAPRYVGLSVSDDGCGIAAGDLERLFDPFFTSKLTGRGLGLPESLGVALAHSGAILVQSQPGQGSVFRLILPQVST